MISIRICKTFYFFLVFLFQCDLHAKIIRGPNFYHEVTGNLNDNPDDTSRPKRIDRDKLRLVAPIDRTFFNGLLAARYELYSEKYSQSLSQTPSDRHVNMLGFTYIPHFDEGPPTWFLTYGYFGDFVQAPMHELSIGINLRNTPFYFSVTEAANVDLYVALYTRRFPWGFRVLPLLMYHAEFRGGWYLKTDIPTNIFVGRVSQDQNWILEFSAYAHSLNYPWTERAGDSGWIDGYTTNYILGGKKRIYRILYGTFYVGVQSSNYWYTIKDDRDVFQQHTEFAPVAMLGMETLFSVK